ncbi:lysyl-tRNA synthetase [Mycoplasma ovis str. Michigan]|uniref:Lysine--tRNA ligase n=1 Tax=Mycoplasma ovis str. Michigan TaxID=1415773 RepID=A0ABM5P0C3_9MOLU|nr:lysine--tRNA ligase [Mycoplasma ovis]AHC39880.1 lysyl-tRNA synthetase [Mycoplasma ovis str. Michigan]
MQEDQNTKRKINDQEEVRRKKLEELKAIGEDAYSSENLVPSHSIKEVTDLSDKYLDQQLSLCGRVIAIRGPFFVIKENNRKIQIYINLKEENSQNIHSYFEKYIDIGDYVYAFGTLFVTHKGTLSLKAQQLKIISKSLKPLPEKWSGIQNPELAIRNRVGNLILNEELFNKLSLRAQIISELRRYLDHLGYLEFETPTLHKIPGGASARPFKTHHNTLKEDLYLRIAPELYLKKLIISGWTHIYEIGKSFRNEGIDNFHNPEFSSIEIYSTYLGLDETMDLTEKIIINLFDKFLTPERKHLFKKFDRKPMWELVKEKTGFDFYNNPPTLLQAIQKSNELGIELNEKDKQSLSRIYEKFFEELASEELKNPTLVYGFSSECSPLAKKDNSNNFFSRRFELYIEGKEIANGFEEQNDPAIQEEQFKKQINSESEFELKLDYDYLSALEYGLPPTGGVGIGLDRLMMLILDSKSIKEVISFPYLKG